MISIIYLTGNAIVKAIKKHRNENKIEHTDYPGELRIQSTFDRDGNRVEHLGIQQSPIRSGNPVLRGKIPSKYRV